MHRSVGLVLFVLAGCGHSPNPGTPDGGTPTTMCPHANDPPPPSGVCTVSAAGGAAAGTLLTGTVLVPGQVLRGGQVFIDGNGTIQCVACDCSAMAGAAQQVSCPHGRRLARAHQHPRPHHVHQRRAHRRLGRALRAAQRLAHRRRAATPSWSTSGGATTDQVHFGELRFLMSGATSTVGSGAATGLLRNLDRASSEEAPLKQPAVQFDTFPLGDTRGQQLTSGCGYPSLPSPTTVSKDLAYEPHIAEGIDAVAHNEWACLDGAAGGVDIALPQSAYIHAVALGAADYQYMAAHMTSLIWSPRSNIRLYGNTAMATAAWRLGVTSRSAPTGCRRAR